MAIPTTPPVLSFNYSGQSPRGRDAQGSYGGVNKNHLKIWKEGDTIIFARYYNGNTSKEPIVSRYDFKSKDTTALAKQIHWGCCGQMSDLSTIYGLIDNLEPLTT